MRMRHWNMIIRRFGRNAEGAAAVEFALILPFLLLLYVGSIEASSLITVDRRVNVISGTVGDLVSRWDSGEGALPIAKLTDYFKASEGIIFPYADGGLKQVVSLLKIENNGTTAVVWSCGYNGGSKRTAGSAYTLAANMLAIVRPPAGDGFVVVSETSYSYLPALGIVFTEPINLYQASYYIPRYGRAITGPAGC
jgi:Flp pilus assembly protein TadG